jgi:hypothetical protein
MNFKLYRNPSSSSMLKFPSTSSQQANPAIKIFEDKENQPVAANTKIISSKNSKVRRRSSAGEGKIKNKRMKSSSNDENHGPLGSIPLNVSSSCQSTPFSSPTRSQQNELHQPHRETVMERICKDSEYFHNQLEEQTNHTHLHLISSSEHDQTKMDGFDKKIPSSLAAAPAPSNSSPLGGSLTSSPSSMSEAGAPLSATGSMTRLFPPEQQQEEGNDGKNGKIVIQTAANEQMEIIPDQIDPNTVFVVVEQEEITFIPETSIHSQLLQLSPPRSRSSPPTSSTKSNSTNTTVEAEVTTTTTMMSRQDNQDEIIELPSLKHLPYEEKYEENILLPSEASQQEIDLVMKVLGLNAIDLTYSDDSLDVEAWEKKIINEVILEAEEIQLRNYESPEKSLPGPRQHIHPHHQQQNQHPKNRRLSTSFLSYFFGNKK